MQSDAKTIPAYLKSLPAEPARVIRKLDRLIRAKLPRAVASMKYGMPTYVVGDRMIAVNAQKHHFSFYADPALVARFRAELSGLDVGKSCIRFRKPGQMPETVIRAIIDAYAAESKPSSRGSAG